MQPSEQFFHIQQIRFAREQYYLVKYAPKPRKSRIKIGEKKFLESLGILPENMEEALQLIRTIKETSEH